MKPTGNEMDCSNFNQKVSPEDFESGDFGTIDLGEAGAEGDTIDFMAQGVMTVDGLQIQKVAILGGGSGVYDESEAEPEDSPILKKLTKGDNEDDEV